MRPTGKPRGIKQKPQTTKSVITGLSEILNALPADFPATKSRADAVRYLARLVDYCESEDYQAVRAKKYASVVAARGLPDAVTYTHPETGETWTSGKRGRRPIWVTELTR